MRLDQDQDDQDQDEASNFQYLYQYINIPIPIPIPIFFLLYFDAGGRSLLIGDHLENCWLATSNSCTESNHNSFSKYIVLV